MPFASRNQEKGLDMRKAWLSLAAVVASMVAAGCSPAGKDEGNAFVLGLDDSFPPMGFRDENHEIVGYDIDLAKEVCVRLGLELKLRPIEWDAKEQELNAGNIDCIWNGFTITPERKEAMTFSPPYLRNAQVVVVRADSGIKTLADLAGKKVATQAGASGEEAIDGTPDFKAALAEVVEFGDYPTALRELKAKGVDAVVMDLIVANDRIRQSGKGNFAILEESLAAEEYGIGFRKGDTELMEKVWGALEAMAADGTVAKISEKWLGADISIIGK